MLDDEELVLGVLNTAPVVDGRPTDELDEPGAAELARRLGGDGSPAELAQLREVRELLHAVVRGEAGAVEDLAVWLDGVVLVPEVGSAGIAWTLRAPAHRVLAARVATAWSRVVAARPGRLRPCGNDECHLFLIDRSRPGTARWCSMATCGNRMKVRAHAARRRDEAASSERVD
ncbi:hypothetical protein SERN_1836 [Serinibacter arcticus]|uniref:Zinc finger CGNR domain-containing protein n=1 Tax=Serinibacter arcticus TaxID=1655435 RepID=A0A4Z1E182_9MICO|nr:hypothetical protein SERN_1836 [Serinibacter arcticus]